MKRSGLLAIMLFWAIMIIGQNIQITFTGTGEAPIVDSVTATNLTTNQSVTFPGSGTLILKQSSGIMSLEDNPMQLRLFPNPFDNTSTLTFNQSEPGKVQISASNLLGQAAFKSDQHLEAGQHSFNLSLNSSGIFLINIIGENEKSSIRAICNKSTRNSVGIVGSGNMIPGTEFKYSMISNNQQTTYSLAYSPEHIMHFECHSDNFTTIIADSPTTSQNYEVEFIDCTDPDGKTYRTVTIGEQVWMAENLAYLPSISPPTIGSDSLSHYYVYGFEGADKLDALTTENYRVYGALYNWPAALNACPTGWHLPSDEEWMALEMSLGMSSLDADKYGSRISGDVGKKLKSRSGWYRNRNGNNNSGFNALPSGRRSDDSDFNGLADDATFWLSTPRGTNFAYYRFLSHYDWVWRDTTTDKDYGFSVRCLKDE
ncbi:MAG: FISUMP domain-containing protein [Bacteroidota bacterium]|nr:FISUMP domain-containing protein [Bacteroidota bacterium]